MCPRCHEPLIVVELEGVELDRCDACGGIWLDAGELEQIVELAGVGPGPLHAALHAARELRRGQRRCPRCRRKMRVVGVGPAADVEGGPERSVEADRCPVGHGWWLDAGELRTIVRSLGGQERGPVAAFLADVLGHALKNQPAGE